MGDLQESPRVASLFFLVFLFFFDKNVWLYNFYTVRPNLACDTFSESPKRALRRKKQDNGTFPLTFCRLQILTFKYFFGHFRDLCYITDPKLLFQAEDGIRDAQESRGLGDVYKRHVLTDRHLFWTKKKIVRPLIDRGAFHWCSERFLLTVLDFLFHFFSRADGIIAGDTEISEGHFTSTQGM